MRPQAAFSTLMVIAFLLVMVPITLYLQQGRVDTGLAVAFVAVAVFLTVISLWMYRRSDVAQIVRPYRRMGFGMFLFIVGALLILAAVTAHLMDLRFADPLLVGLASEPLRLPGLNKLLPVTGAALMLIGLWVGHSDKQFIKLDR